MNDPYTGVPIPGEEWDRSLWQQWAEYLNKGLDQDPVTIYDSFTGVPTHKKEPGILDLLVEMANSLNDMSWVEPRSTFYDFC
jgi:hypothetical protein